MKWNDIREHARMCAELDRTENITFESWNDENAWRDLEDHLLMSDVWRRYKGTKEEEEAMEFFLEEEEEAMEFFLEEYKKELQKLWE